jgi:enamine deaminase RidA (YjgF/YER057c/UK114 family)
MMRQSQPIMPATTRERAAILLYQAIEGRTDHASLVSITARQRCGGITLTWRDYLTREEGPLAVVSDQDIEASVSHLVAVLQQWRATVLPPKKPAQSCSGVNLLTRAAIAG